MANTTAQKLRIREGMQLLTFHAPENFASRLGPLPPGVQVAANTKDYQQIHWFVQNKAAVEGEMEKITGMLKGDVVCWIYYPKLSSKIQTDLSRDKGWDKLLAHGELKWISLISFDDTWSAFGMRLKTDADKTQGKPAMRPVQDYINANTRTVRLPGDLEKALAASGQAAANFCKLSFSNKKEYVEWIVSAKREETRLQRVGSAVEKLALNWKNPRNL